MLPEGRLQLYRSSNDQWPPGAHGLCTSYYDMTAHCVGLKLTSNFASGCPGSC